MDNSKLSTFVLLSSDKIVRGVFEAVLRNRSAIFKELVLSVGAKPDDPVARGQVEQALASLKDADLIKERPASIEDFNSYYVTSEGLGVERRLRSEPSPFAP